MFSEKMVGLVNAGILEELKSSKEHHEERFTSTEEAFGAMLGEFVEVLAEIDGIEPHIMPKNGIETVKALRENRGNLAEKLVDLSEKLVYESAQFAAMCRKYAEFTEGKANEKM